MEKSLVGIGMFKEDIHCSNSFCLNFCSGFEIEVAKYE